MINKAYKFFCGCLVFCGFAASLASCDDFFNQESSDVLYDDVEHLNNNVDTVYSVAGILAKLQELGDRTVLLGEIRGDLVSLTGEANNDLREIATFSVSDSNKYNRPSDYYAVINNCNYFIAHADTSLRNRNEYVLMEEYAAVKAIRAWTYLQLVLNYGQVPFVTEPLLSREAAEEAEKAQIADLQQVCTYFINDLANLRPDLNNKFPLGGITSISGVSDTKQLFFPLSLIRAELYLWRASVTGSNDDYRQAALHYFQFINERNGDNSTYPTSTDRLSWEPGESLFRSHMTGLYPISEAGELITMIAYGSTPAAGSYSELRDLFTSRRENNYRVSITPSTGMFELSESQANAILSVDGTSVTYAPEGLDEHRSGDLRLASVWSEGWNYDQYTEERVRTQSITKYRDNSQHVFLWRNMTVYLHLAEALNGAGYPRMAFMILQQGLSNKIISTEVMPYYNTEADSIYLSRFNFNDVRYGVLDVNGAITRPTETQNMIGIHTRGSGWTPMNEFYQFPDSILVDTINVPVALDVQKAYVDSLLLNENALEFAFEGTRYYDIMRFAMRQPNPGQFLANQIYKRGGKGNEDATRSEIKTDLTNQRNWYLRWKGKIGF